ncbi:MAG: hypothetical protein FD149_1902 [Rhodospirillaceae bacterium]|nr:MAG: hypothetical protein FD149_1902 [Rhodospirillaceae bacterium]
MERYRRIMVFIDFNREDREIARRAWTLARAPGARFALAHVVDWGAGLACDEVLPLTPGEVKARLMPVVRRMLDTVAARIGVHGHVPLVSFPGPAVAALVKGWQPDVVVRRGPPGTSRLVVPGWECDVITMRVPTFSAASRVAAFLSRRRWPMAGTVLET